MSTFGFIECNDASPEMRAVYDDIMATRKTDSISNFWKAIAHDPELLKRTWEDTKQIMAAGALDAVVKELIYVRDHSLSGGCMSTFGFIEYNDASPEVRAVYDDIM